MNATTTHSSLLSPHQFYTDRLFGQYKDEWHLIVVNCCEGQHAYNVRLLFGRWLGLLLEIPWTMGGGQILLVETVNFERRPCTIWEDCGQCGETMNNVGRLLAMQRDHEQCGKIVDYVGIPRAMWEDCGLCGETMNNVERLWTMRGDHEQYRKIVDYVGEHEQCG